MTSRLRKPARTPHAAVQRYTDYLQQSLACVSNSVWCFGPPVRAGEDHWVLFLPDDQPIPLNRRDNLGRVHLRAIQRFRVIEDPEHEGEWKTTTREYIYQVFDESGPEGAEPLAEWHWHPGRKVQHPHLHARFPGSNEAWGVWCDKLHLPTERVAFEEVLAFLIEELGVVTRHDDWQDHIGEALEAFRLWRTWPRSR